MKSRMIFSLALASLSLIFSTGCSTPLAKKKSDGVTKAQEEETRTLGGTHYTTLVFDKGKSSLSETSKKFLINLSARAHKENRPIEEIRILAWADKEYPDKVKGEATTSDIILASERAKKIKNFLEDDLKAREEIDAFNMAKRPNLMSKLFRNDEYDVKSAYESSGATSSRLPDGSISYTKASKALVIIDYKGEMDNIK